MIRRAELADGHRIAQIHIASWKQAYAGLLPNNYLAGLDGELSQRTAQWEDWLTSDSDRRLILVAEEAGELVGFAHAGPTGDRDLSGKDTAEIYAVYLDPRFLGRGWGSRLMIAVQQHLQSAGFSDFAVWVMTGNKGARDFYEHLGWEGDGSEKDHCMGLPIPAVRYRRSFESAKS